jgi:ribonuclease D
VDWIDSDEGLQAAARSWSEVIGLDTEFQRTDTFYPIPGLYQVACAAGTALVDPLAVAEWMPFVEVLEDPRTVKVMHACSEDLELLSHHLGVAPSSLFDTQYAHAFLSDAFSMSYANLVRHELGIELDKHQTRSNWLRRPLSAEQVRYAAEDVDYLIEIHARQCKALAERDRLAWYEEDMAGRSAYRAVDPDEYFTNIKRAWKLDERQLGVLRELCAWRERQAMAEDVPRGRIVWDEHLYGFAAKGRLTAADVGEVLPRAIARRYTEVLVEAHERGTHEPAEALPRPLSQGQANVTRRLRTIASECAQRHGFATELVARKRDIEACMRSYLTTGELSDFYRGWRAPLLADAFMSVLEDGA